MKGIGHRPSAEIYNFAVFPLSTMTTSPSPDKAAHTIVTLRQRFGGYSLVDAELRSGRTHQIRLHLAASGFPIVGDDKYGTY